MEEIKTFTEEHLQDVSDLCLSSGRGQNRPAPPGLVDAFRQIYLQNPWMAPDLPSLVYIENGKLVGFLGVIPRPMEFRGRPIRALTINMWLVDHRNHRGLAGMKLMKQVLTGPQDFSYNDGSSNEATTIYAALGARVSHVYSFNWVRVLRPFQTARGIFDRMGGALAAIKGPSGIATKPLDFLTSKLPVGALNRPQSPLSSKSVSVGELLQAIQESRGREPLKPAYSLPSMEWLFTQARKGEKHQGLRLMTVHSQDGTRCGWFVCYARPGHPALVLQVGCYRQQQIHDVLSALFADAWDQGASAVKGQAIPQFNVPLTELHCLFRQPYACVVGYARDPEIMQAYRQGDAALSRLDGGGWLPFSADPWP